MIWIVFSIFMVALAVLFLGGLCSCAGKADREIERLELEEKARR